MPMDRAVFFSSRTPAVRPRERLSLHPSATHARGWNRKGKVSVAGLLLTCLMLLACLPVILSGTTRGRAAYDSLNYHEKAIRQFAQELPNPRLDDYLSATTPGYHLVLAAVGRSIAGIGSDGVSAYTKNITPTPPDPVIASERRTLQFTGLLFTLLLSYTIGHWTERHIGLGGCEPAPALAALCLALPLIGSPYIYQSAAWLLPDNSAWLGVVALLLLALRPRITVTVLLTMGLILTWLVLARQIHAWAAGLLWASAWLSQSLDAQREQGPLVSIGDVITPARAGPIARSLALAVLCTIPAALVLGAFWKLWNHQLVPPTFTVWHHAGLQGATPAFILSLIAIVAPFFASWLWPGLCAAWHDHRAWLLAAVVVGVALAILPPSAWDFDHGRFGGIWNIYRLAGAIGGRSIALALLAPIGAAVTVAALAGIALRQRWIMLAALAGFAIANCANPQLWQRYHEPFVLFWIVIAASLIASRAQRPDTQGLPRLWKLAGPAALACLLGAMSAVLILRAQPEIDKGYRLGQIETPPQLVPQNLRP